MLAGRVVCGFGDALSIGAGVQVIAANGSARWRLGARMPSGRRVGRCGCLVSESVELYTGAAIWEMYGLLGGLLRGRGRSGRTGCLNTGVEMRWGGMICIGGRGVLRQW